MALLPMAIITIFWKERIGLSLTEIMILQGIFSAATFLCEYPSGYLADRFGYRATLIMAALLSLLGWSLYLVAGDFWSVALAEIILGVSYAAISGADCALLYESLAAENKQHAYHHHDGVMNAWAQSGEAIGALVAGALYAFFPLAPFVGQVLIWVIAIVIGFRLVDISVSAEKIRPSVIDALRVARKGFSGNREVRSIILLSTVLGLASFYPVWLIQPYMQEGGIAIGWFGPVWALANGTVALFALLSNRIVRKLQLRGALILCMGLILLGYAGMGFGGAATAFVWYLLLTAMRGIHGPLSRHLLQQLTGSGERASILSLKSFVFRLGFILSGPLIGALADHRGIGFAFLLLGVLVPAVGILPLRSILKADRAGLLRPSSTGATVNP